MCVCVYTYKTETFQESEIPLLYVILYFKKQSAGWPIKLVFMDQSQLDIHKGLTASGAFTQ